MTPSSRFAITVLMLLSFSVLARPARAQDHKHDAQLRTVHGSVLDKGENPVVTGVVYLKNVKTLQVKTHISDDTGEYRFSGLDPNVDYEIHAEHEDLCSPTRTVSSFDTRKDIEVVLKLSRKCGK
jgi:Carboxypeptidase regulatory-like domain